MHIYKMRVLVFASESESLYGSECILLCHYFQRIVAIYYVDGTVRADDAGLLE